MPILPADLEASILQAAQDLKAHLPYDFKLSVRSSATSEDSEASFAGQHATVLNVSEANLIEAYKDVVASTFSPRAIYYRRRRGYRDQDVNMSVACIVMIHAKVSGVMYTVDPNDSRHAVIMISAVWGLAADAVDGSAATDFYQVHKKTLALEASEIALKERRLRPDAADGVLEEDLPEDLKRAACLTEEEVRLLADYAVRLETHYGYALDIEWAIDPQGKLYILQARPLKRSQRFGAEAVGATDASPEAAAVPQPLILQGGQTACDGAASGYAYVIQSDHTLHHIPEGVVVVARQTSPRYVPLMGRIRAFITDVGSVTGHMASVAREFRIPTLVGTGNGTTLIAHGEEITVDATRRMVYRGRVEHLLTQKMAVNPMKDSPTYNLMKSVLKRIAPLSLTDPQQDNFHPAGCRTLHDIIRFAHEMSMQEMFRISDGVAPDECVAVPLRAYLPMKIFLVDLGNGLRKGFKAPHAELDDVTSIPFQALLRGHETRKRGLVSGRRHQLGRICFDCRPDRHPGPHEGRAHGGTELRRDRRPLPQFQLAPRLPLHHHRQLLRAGGERQLHHVLFQGGRGRHRATVAARADDRSNFEKAGLQGGSEERHGPGRDEEIPGGSPPGATGPAGQAAGIGAPARHAPLRRPPDRLVRGAVPERKLPVCVSRGMTIRWHGRRHPQRVGASDRGCSLRFC